MSKKHEPGMAYDMTKMNRLFAFLSFLLLVTTLWVFLDDYIRPWKVIQLEAQKIERRKLQEQIQQEDENIDKEKFSEIERQLASAKETVAQRAEEIAQVREELKLIQKDITDETINNGRLNALSSDQNFRYENAVGHGYSQSRIAGLLETLRGYKESHLPNRGSA